MIYCLDSNICVYATKNLYPSLTSKLELLPPELLAVPTIVKAELLYGAEKSERPQQARFGLERFLAPMTLLPFDDEATMHYARIRADLERAGKPIGPHDLIIAATALAHGAILVTNNVREFARVPALTIENWTQK